MRTSLHTSIDDWKIQLRRQEAIYAGFACSSVHQSWKPRPSGHGRRASRNGLEFGVKANVYEQPWTPKAQQIGCWETAGDIDPSAFGARHVANCKRLKLAM